MKQLLRVRRFYEAKLLNLFPTADMLLALDRKFGLSAEDAPAPVQTKLESTIKLPKTTSITSIHSKTLAPAKTTKAANTVVHTAAVSSYQAFQHFKAQRKS